MIAPTEIELNASRLLTYIAEYTQGDEQKRGRYPFDGQELADAMHFNDGEFADAIEMLEAEGLVKVFRTMGEGPNGYRGIQLTVDGRNEYQRRRMSTISVDDEQTEPEAAPAEQAQSYAISDAKVREQASRQVTEIRLALKTGIEGELFEGDEVEFIQTETFETLNEVERLINAQVDDQGQRESVLRSLVGRLGSVFGAAKGLLLAVGKRAKPVHEVVIVASKYVSLAAALVALFS